MAAAADTPITGGVMLEVCQDVTSLRYLPVAPTVTPFAQAFLCGD